TANAGRPAARFASGPLGSAPRAAATGPAVVSPSSAGAAQPAKVAAEDGWETFCVGLALVHRRRGSSHANAAGGQVVFDAPTARAPRKLPLFGTSRAQRSGHARERPKSGRFHACNA